MKFHPIEEPEPSEYNEGWRFWVSVGAAVVVIFSLGSVLLLAVGVLT